MSPSYINIAKKGAKKNFFIISNIICSMVFGDVDCRLFLRGLTNFSGYGRYYEGKLAKIMNSLNNILKTYLYKKVAHYVHH